MKYTGLLSLPILIPLLTIGCSNPPKPMPDSIRHSMVQQLTTVNSCYAANHFNKSEGETVQKLLVGLNDLSNYKIDSKQLAAEVEIRSKQNKVTKQVCLKFAENLATRYKAKKAQHDLANAITSSTLSNQSSYSYKPVPSLVPAMTLPNAPSLSSWAAKPALQPTTVYKTSDCIGSVVNGRCTGTIKPSAQYKPLPTKCYGTVVNGRCAGASF